MGYHGLLFFGIIHLALFPPLLLWWIVVFIVNHSRWTGLRMPFTKLKCTTGGSIAKEFESVHDNLKWYCANGGTLGLQFYGSVDGIEVVNIFGRVDNHRKSLLSDGTPYDMGAQQCVWSMTKVVMCTVIMIAVERGWLKYDDPIAKHWPEFAEKFGPDSEKAKATITQALRHELGLWKLNKKVPVAELKPEGLETYVKTLEDEPLHNFGEARYHMVNSGFVLAEVVRRVDPLHRGIGQFIKEEIAGPLQLDLLLGKKNSREGGLPVRIAKSTMGPIWWLSLLYATLFSVVIMLKTVLLPILLLPIKVGAIPIKDWVSKWFDLTRCLAYKDPDTDFHRSFPIIGLPLWQAEAIVNFPGWYELELATANMLSNAESMGRLATCLANGGEFRGQRILQESTIQLALGDPQPKMMKGIGEIPVCFTRGGFNRQETEGGYVSEAMKGTNYKIEEGALDAFYGWAGWGGLSFSFNPHRRLGSSFCSNAMTWDMFVADNLSEEYLKVCGKLLAQNKQPSTPEPIGVGMAGAGSPPVEGATMPIEPVAAASESNGPPATPVSPSKKSQVVPEP